jgi:hypothetical protein
LRKKNTPSLFFKTGDAFFFSALSVERKKLLSVASAFRAQRVARVFHSLCHSSSMQGAHRAPKLLQKLF